MSEFDALGVDRVETAPGATLNGLFHFPCTRYEAGAFQAGQQRVDGATGQTRSLDEFQAKGTVHVKQCFKYREHGRGATQSDSHMSNTTCVELDMARGRGDSRADRQLKATRPHDRSIADTS